jgi:hypothetical protein
MIRLHLAIYSCSSREKREERVIRLMKKPVVSSGCPKECPAVHIAEEGVCEGKVAGIVRVIVDQIPQLFTALYSLNKPSIRVRLTSTKPAERSPSSTTGGGTEASIVSQ